MPLQRIENGKVIATCQTLPSTASEAQIADQLKQRADVQNHRDSTRQAAMKKAAAATPDKSATTKPAAGE